jgi:hypothetical protein
MVRQTFSLFFSPVVPDFVVPSPPILVPACRPLDGYDDDSFVAAPPPPPPPVPQ